MNCGRKACKILLGDSYFKIWNGINGQEPSLYCVSCGRKIIRANDSLRYSFESPKPTALISSPQYREDKSF